MNPLLRELAIAVILPFRADMREQIRGAAYTALKEIHSEDMVPLLEEGLGDGSGMIRALVAEGLAGPGVWANVSKISSSTQR